MLSKFYRRLSIRAQILIVAIAPTLIVTLILVVLAYRDNVAQGQQTLHRQGTLLAAQLAANLEYPLFTGATEQLPTLIQAMVKPAATVLGTEVIRVTVLGKDQRIVYADPNAAVPAPAPLDGDPLLAPNAFPTDRQRFVAPIYLEPLALPAPAPLEKRYLGAVELELATAPVQIEQSQHFLRNIGLVSITFVAGLILACWTGYRLARSLRQTARAIERIKGGDLSVRLSRTEVNEIGILQDGVNLLAETIAGEQARLENELAKVRGEYDQVLARLQVQTQTAEQANQAKSLFLAKVSHEMRTPLYSIQGLAEQLLRAVSNPEEERTVQTLLGAVRTLYNTISDILDFTQLERGKYTPHFELLDLWAEIEQVIETIAPLAARQRLYLDVIVEPRTPTTVWSDSRALRAIVTNLIANAVKFTERGGICIRLSAPSGPTDGSVLVYLRVQDTGCGIPADQMATIFAPFEQVDGALNRRFGGTGLGLSIVKGYCDVLNGHIGVESRLGQGTTFTVTLPFSRVDPNPHAPLNLPKKWRALVVDDRPSFRESVRCRLENLGLAVTEQPGPAAMLNARPPPALGYDLLVAQNVSALPPQTRSEQIERWHDWAQYIISLETGPLPSPPSVLDHSGISLVLSAAITRAAWYAELSPLLANVRLEENTVPHHRRRRHFLTGKTVLVVEDFELNLEIMTRQLRRHGLRVLEASDADEATRKATCPDLRLILMDIQMPGTDGVAAIQAIRALPAGAGLPILAFTASADQPTHHRAMAAGANGVLVKPLSEEELINAVYETLLGFDAPLVTIPTT